MSQFRRRFLVVRLSSVGDIVHTLPAVSALGESFPDAEIHWAVETRYSPLLEGNPSVHKLVKLDTLGWRASLSSAKTLEDIVRGVLTLREPAFDAALDFQGLFKSALVARISRSHERIGFGERSRRELAAGFFYTQTVEPRELRHMIEINLALVERLGARAKSWQFPLPRKEADERNVADRLAAAGDGDFVIINPGGGWSSKRWPPENYAELIRRLESEFPWLVLVTGSREEEPLIRRILERVRPERARYFSSSLVQFVALARRARIFVGGDTGPMHLAAAAGTPIVALFNAEDRLNTPERNGPFNPSDITLTNREALERGQARRDAPFLDGIPVGKVLEAVCSRVERTHG